MNTVAHNPSLVGLLLVGLLASCSETDNLLSEQETAIAMTEKTGILMETAHYFNNNESGNAFLRSRSLLVSDIKYGLARQMTYDGHLFLNIPVIRGSLVPGAPVSESLRGEAVRKSVVIEYDDHGKVQEIGYLVETPNKPYAALHKNDLYYSLFEGEAALYDRDGQRLGMASFAAPCTRNGGDSIPELDGGTLGEVVVIGHHDGGWSDYPPGGGYDDDDGSMNPWTCPVCGAATNPGDPTCPQAYLHGNGGGGSGDDGGLSSECKMDGVFNHCSLDTAGVRVLKESIDFLITKNPMLHKVQNYLSSIGSGFGDVVLNDSLKHFGQYSPVTKTYIFSDYNAIDRSLTEEYIHMFQDNVYMGGIAQYAYSAYNPDVKGSANIEFEAKFLTDLSCHSANCACAFMGGGVDYADAYENWIELLCQKISDGEMSYEEIERGYDNHSYEDFMLDYAKGKLAYTSYSLSQIKTGMQPEALMFILKNLF